MVEKRETGFPSVPDIGCDHHHPDHIVDRVSTQRRSTGARRKSTVGRWTDEEDEKLEEAVRQYGGKNWKMIASKLPGRTDVQCLHRWQKVLDPNLIKGPWTKEEDEIIIELVAKHGEKRWSLIAKSLPGRIGKQCRERWNNHLKPGIIRTPWTDAEDLIIIQAHRRFGNKWAELAKLLPGRTENAIKNRWNCTLSKRVNGGSIVKRKPGSQCLNSCNFDLNHVVDEAREPMKPQVMDGHSNEYLPSLRIMNQNNSILIRDSTAQSASLDDLSNRIKVTATIDESPSLGLFESPSPSIKRSKIVLINSASNMSLGPELRAITASSYSSSMPLPSTRLSLDCSCPESLLKSAADTYQNLPSIIRKRKSLATTNNEKDSSRHDPKQVSRSSSPVPEKSSATCGIKLFGRRLEHEFDVAAEAPSAEYAEQTLIN